MNTGMCMCAIPPGDHVAGMLAVAVASSRTLEVLDLEGTGLTNQSAQVRHLHVWGRPEVGVEVSQGVCGHTEGVAGWTHGSHLNCCLSFCILFST